MNTKLVIALLFAALLVFGCITAIPPTRTPTTQLVSANTTTTITPSPGTPVDSDLPPLPPE